MSKIVPTTRPWVLPPLTSTSIRPKRSTASLTRRSASAGLLGCPSIKNPVPTAPSMSAGISAAFAAEQKPATRAPAAAKARMTTLPVSDSLSVRRTTLSSTRIGAAFLYMCNRGGPYRSSPKASNTRTSSMCDASAGCSDRAADGVILQIALAVSADQVHQVLGQGAEVAIPLVHEDEIVIEVELPDIQLDEIAPLQLFGDRHAENRRQTHAELGA